MPSAILMHGMHEFTCILQCTSSDVLLPTNLVAAGHALALTWGMAAVRGYINKVSYFYGS